MPSFAALPADDVWRAVTYIKSLSAGRNEVASGNAAALVQDGTMIISAKVEILEDGLDARVFWRGHARS